MSEPGPALTYIQTQDCCIPHYVFTMFPCCPSQWCRNVLLCLSLRPLQLGGALSCSRADAGFSVGTIHVQSQPVVPPTSLPIPTDPPGSSSADTVPLSPCRRITQWNQHKVWAGNPFSA